MRTRRARFWLDAGLYTFGAMFVFQQGFLSNDDAYKYINPFTLFWLKYATGSLAAGCAALKGFVSDPGTPTPDPVGKINLT